MKQNINEPHSALANFFARLPEAQSTLSIRSRHYYLDGRLKKTINKPEWRIPRR